MQTWGSGTRGSSDNREPYLLALRRHAHELLKMGYRRLVPSQFAATQEPEITGKLVEAMHSAMQEPNAPDWVVHYELPKDDPPLNTPGRSGRARPRIDIEFVRVQLGPRPRLGFEAKRLGKNHRASGYLGSEGLGCFLSGKYPADHGEAGMLGYVQAKDEKHWAAKISASLNRDAHKYAICTGGEWVKVPVVPGLEHTYQTRHAPPERRVPLLVHHVLLRFC